MKFSESKKKVALPMEEIMRLGIRVVQRNVMYRRSRRICCEEAKHRTWQCLHASFADNHNATISRSELSQYILKPLNHKWLKLNKSIVSGSLTPRHAWNVQRTSLCCVSKHPWTLKRLLLIDSHLMHCTAFLTYCPPDYVSCSCPKLKMYKHREWSRAKLKFILAQFMLP